MGSRPPGRGVTWGDYDNDGDLDLFLAKGNTIADKLFRNDGNGTFTDATSGPLGNTGDGTAVSWVDYDLDGDLDLHLVNGGSSSPDKLFRNDGCAGFVDATPSPLADTGNGQAAAWGDYDSDADPDLYLVKQGSGAQGKNKLFRNNGGGVFVDVTSNPIDDQDAGQAAAWGDYDNDGDLDLVLINNPGTNRLFRNNGGGSFSTVSGVPFSGAGRGVAWADYDNDRDLDLYITNDGANQLLRNDAGTFVNVTQPPLGDTGIGRGVAWADFDRDGHQDLYFANNGPNKLLRNLGVSNNRWLQVALTGVQSNSAGIGARIRVVAGGVVQIREITGGSGYRSQNSLVAGFGLGSSTIVDTLRVRWPSGVVQVQTQVGTNAVATVCEPDTAGVIASSMIAWSESNPDPSYMTLRFRFNATRRATQFEVRYRVGSTGTWLYKTCTGPSSSCLFPCNGNLEGSASYTPCAFTNFQWQARAFNCNSWSTWSPTKLFTAQCLTEP